MTLLPAGGLGSESRGWGGRTLLYCLVLAGLLAGLLACWLAGLLAEINEALTTQSASDSTRVPPQAL